MCSFWVHQLCTSFSDDATKGSLGTRDNFNGCIRNIALERPIKDWTDMDSLHNVLLDSCPLH